MYIRYQTGNSLLNSNIFFRDRLLDESKEADAKNRLNWDLLEEKAIAALPQLMKGKEHRFKVTSWEILMRPVLALKQECRGCHTNEKPDSTLGVMVYAVKADSGNHFVSESALHGERITDYLDD